MQRCLVGMQQPQLASNEIVVALSRCCRIPIGKNLLRYPSIEWLIRGDTQRMQSCRHEIIDLQGRHLCPPFDPRAPGHEYPFLLMNALALGEPLPEVFAPDIEVEGCAAIGDQDEVLLIGTEGTYPVGIGGINS